MSNGLHQQLEQKRKWLAIDEAKAVAEDTDPREASDIEIKLPREREEVARLEAQIASGEEALRLIETGLGFLGNLDAGVQLQLSIHAAEASAWRLRNHLGKSG